MRHSKFALPLPRSLGLSLAAVGSLGSLSAATFQVTSNADSGPGSLRQALLDANAMPGTDAIDIQVSGEIRLSSGPLLVADDVAINGPGADLLAVDAQSLSRVMQIQAGHAMLTGLTLRNGVAPSLQPGGGVLVSGDLTLLRCVVRDCVTQMVPGVNADGGGVLVNSGRRLIAESSLFLNNRVPLGTGGAVRGGPGSIIEVLNCTFSGNSANQGGALSLANGGLLRFCTFADNSASSAGGAVWTPVMAARVSNSIVFRNQAPNGPDWYGAAQSGGFNLLGSAFGSSGWVLSDRSGLDPLLVLLADNGGGTMTYALEPGSPAVDAADPSSTEAEDQRGMLRPQGAGPDIGAFEREVVNRPPQADAGDDLSAPSEGSLTYVQLDGSGSSDPDGDDLAYEWFLNGTRVANEETPMVGLPNGSHVLLLRVTDPSGASSEDEVQVTVVAVDNFAPKIRHVFAWPSVLYPANGTMRQVRVCYTVKDKTDPNPTVWLTVESNQADSGLGQGDKPGDFEVVSKNSVRLRAEQFGSRRVYTIFIHAKDRDGNVTVRKVKVRVPQKPRWCP